MQGEAFSAETLLDAEALLRDWRDRRAGEVASVVSWAAGLLLTVGVTLDAFFASRLVLIFDLLGLACCIASALLARVPAARDRAWVPLYAGIWAMSFPNVAESGGIMSPQLGSYATVLFGLGILIQSRVSPLALSLFVGSTYFFWVLVAFLRGDWSALLAEHGNIIVGQTLLVAGGLACFVVFVRAERKLAAAVAQGNRRLVDARVELAQVSQTSAAKTSFLVNMSHELRTPLTSVLGYADLLASDALDSAGRQQFHAAIKRNGLHLLALVDDLLDLARIESGRLRVEVSDMDPRTLVTDVAQTLEHNARVKGITLATELADDLPPKLSTDPTRARQVLLNLVGNAVKFTDRGAVVVRAERQADDLVVTVADTGCGIAPADQEKLFRPFSQVDATLTRRFGGAGVGLTLARELARLLGGDVALIRTQVGEGSVFRVAFPLMPRIP